MQGCYPYKKNRRKATEVDPKYVKAWVRLGVSEFELENYESAQNAYNQALQLTPATDKNWELYMERVQLCEQKLNNNNEKHQMPDMSQLGNLLGGMGNNPNFANMLNNMGGMEGLLNNPMISQMANNLMKDPNMMANLQNMMGNPDAQNAMKNMFGGGGGGSGSGNS